MEINTIEENDILRDKSKQYLEERLESDDYGLTGDVGESVAHSPMVVSLP